MAREGRWFLVMMTMCACLCVACTGSKNKKEEQKVEDDSAFLDDPVDVDRTIKPKESGVMMIPAATDELSIELDGEPTGWDLKKEAREFGSKAHVEAGQRHWSGSSDASMKVAVKSDANYIYFWLEASDDVIIEDDDRGGLPVDGLVLWLRDPGLERVAGSLPDGVDSGEELVSDLAVVFTPDGRVRRYDSGSAFNFEAIRSLHFKNKKSWGVEVAIRAEVLPHIHTFPVEEMAFRVELLDGDDTKRPGVQTTMSMIPDAKDGSPRFALYGMDGLLPHEEASGAVFLPDPIGFWTRQKKGGWSYRNIEVVPSLWSPLAEQEQFIERIAKSADLDKKCNLASHDRHFQDFMESRSKRHRVGLMVCAAREVAGKCSGGARTRLYWVHYTPEADDWGLDEAVDITGVDLPQCYKKPDGKNFFYDHFALMPLEFFGNNIWILGWKRTMRDSDFAEEVHGSWIFNTKNKKKGLVREVISYRSAAEGRARVVSKTAAHFVEVDETKGFDLCEIERVEEQTCSRMNSGCATDNLGKSTLVHLHTWLPKRAKFDRYMLSKHPRCKHDFDFSRREGYLLLHTGSRVGFLPSAANVASF